MYWSFVDQETCTTDFFGLIKKRELLFRKKWIFYCVLFFNFVDSHSLKWRLELGKRFFLFKTNKKRWNDLKSYNERNEQISYSTKNSYMWLTWLYSNKNCFNWFYFISILKLNNVRFTYVYVIIRISVLNESSLKENTIDFVDVIAEKLDKDLSQKSTKCRSNLLLVLARSCFIWI